MGENATTVIFDIAHECLSCFEQVATKQDDSLLTRSFVPGYGTDRYKERNKSPRDFLGLLNSFSFWTDYTGALSLMESSLDSRLRGLEDISSMVIELLDMVLRNLHHREFAVSLDSHTWHHRFPTNGLLTEMFLLA
jgi:hypothetical protein